MEIEFGDVDIKYAEVSSGGLRIFPMPLAGQTYIFLDTEELEEALRLIKQRNQQT
jgi:hypothetical protein